LLRTKGVEELKKVQNWKVLDPYNDQLEGDDTLGALLIFNHNPLTGEKKNWCYWYGTILGQGTSKFFGPTIIQVASGVLTAIRYACENPQKGPNYSESLPTPWVLETARPYLGKLGGVISPWSPASTQFVDLEVKEKL